MKKLIGAIAALFVASAVYAASLGTPPQNGGGPALIDQSWLYGLSGGLNQTNQSGIAAAGTTQATATQLPAGIALISVDTVAASSGVNLPPCLSGTEIKLYNNGANTLTIYPAVANNPITAAQDTINATTSASQTTHTSKAYYCPKNGIWAAQ